MKCEHTGLRNYNSDKCQTDGTIPTDDGADRISVHGVIDHLKPMLKYRYNTCIFSTRFGTCL